MSRETVRNRSGEIIGFIETESSGKQVIFDDELTRLGSYDPRENYTFDAQWNRVGSGNLLTTLL